MLRITLPTNEETPVYVLEGRLVGIGVDELLRVTREIGPNTNCLFNLEDVLYVDQLGEKVLRRFNRLGARFVTNTAYGKNLCERLHLRRARGTQDYGDDRVSKELCVVDAHRGVRHTD